MSLCLNFSQFKRAEAVKMEKETFFSSKGTRKHFTKMEIHFSLSTAATDIIERTEKRKIFLFAHFNDDELFFHKNL
jgi:hypothetical protein